MVIPKDLSSPIYATAIGLLKYTIDNLPDKVYVEYSNQGDGTGRSSDKDYTWNSKTTAMMILTMREVEEAVERTSVESKFWLHEKIESTPKTFEPTRITNYKPFTQLKIKKTWNLIYLIIIIPSSKSLVLEAEEATQ